MSGSADDRVITHDPSDRDYAVTAPFEWSGKRFAYAGTQ